MNPFTQAMLLAATVRAEEQPMNLYTLDANRNPVPCTDTIRWCQWMQTADRKVDLTVIGPVDVSTVFLGLDHSHGQGSPLLWETMTFSDDLNGPPQEQDRCSGTWADAQAMHDRMVDKIRNPQDT